MSPKQRRWVRNKDINEIPVGKVSRPVESKKFDGHEESAKHRESENPFAAKNVAQMAEPTRCYSTKNTLGSLNSYR
jgi:hypothetical protein